jgi:hypothetical protein
MSSLLPTGGTIPKSKIYTSEYVFENTRISTLVVTDSVSFFDNDQTTQQSVDFDIDSIILLLKTYGLAAENIWLEGNLIISTDNTGLAKQGTSVSISSDGNTLAIGGPTDNSNVGAVWIYVKTGTVWAQQDKLIGTGGTGVFHLQGTSVSLSADGNTLAVGGPGYNSNVGAAWIFSRTGVSWAQQGATPLIGTGGTGVFPLQGTSVSLSADGNTLVVGGPGDNTNVGAAWIFFRTGVSWAQQDFLEASDNTGASLQGTSVSISADGDNVVVGGPADDTNIGATWVYTRSGVTWTQQGLKLVGADYTGTPLQGSAVSIYEDTIVIGGPNDFFGRGASWIFTRSLGVWTQLLGPIVGTGESDNPMQGTSVSVYNETIAIGGSSNNLRVGAVWMYIFVDGAWVQESPRINGVGFTGVPTQGVSVSLANNTVIIGGPGDNFNEGAVWIFNKI